MGQNFSGDYMLVTVAGSGSHLLHLRPLRVIICRLIEVRPYNFADQDRIIAGKTCHWVVYSVLELGVQAETKLSDIELLPINAKLLANDLCFG